MSLLLVAIFYLDEPISDFEQSEVKIDLEPWIIDSLSDMKWRSVRVTMKRAALEHFSCFSNMFNSEVLPSHAPMAFMRQVKSKAKSCEAFLKKVAESYEPWPSDLQTQVSVVMSSLNHDINEGTATWLIKGDQTEGVNVSPINKVVKSPIEVDMTKNSVAAEKENRGNSSSSDSLLPKTSNDDSPFNTASSESRSLPDEGQHNAEHDTGTEAGTDDSIMAKGPQAGGIDSDIGSRDRETNETAIITPNKVSESNAEDGQTSDRHRTVGQGVTTARKGIITARKSTAAGKPNSDKKENTVHLPYSPVVDVLTSMMIAKTSKFRAAADGPKTQSKVTDFFSHQDPPSSRSAVKSAKASANPGFIAKRFEFPEYSSCKYSDQRSVMPEEDLVKYFDNVMTTASLENRMMIDPHTALKLFNSYTLIRTSSKDHLLPPIHATSQCLRVHETIAQPSEETIVCIKCGKHYKDPWTAIFHVESHIVEIVCVYKKEDGLVCNMVFEHSREFIRHVFGYHVRPDLVRGHRSLVTQRTLTATLAATKLSQTPSQQKKRRDN